MLIEQCLFQKLVNDTFQNMWFTPLKQEEDKKLLTRVMNIIDVVASCKDTGFEWFEQLLDNVSDSLLLLFFISDSQFSVIRIIISVYYKFAAVEKGVREHKQF